MDQATLQRYAPGGDIYADLQTQYGTAAANQVYAAAQTGDNNGEVAAALAQIRYGAPADTSTADAFVDQITTDPLGAPLSGLNTLLSNSIFDFFKNPAVLVTLGLIVFFVLGGGAVIQKHFNKLK
jgi:hypothetical protein